MKLFLAASFIFVFQAAWADDVNYPDLYVDGKALANAVTCMALDNSREDQRFGAKWYDDLAGSLDYLRDGSGFQHHSSDLSAGPGDTFKFEDQLNQWVLDQPDRSIYPAQFFEQAILIADGNILDAFVLSWNHL